MMTLGVTAIQNKPSLLKDTMLGEIVDKRANKSLGYFISSKYEALIRPAIDEIEKMSPAAIIISPGPGYPKDAGISEGGHKDIQWQDPYTWRLSRTPGDSRSIRWKDSSCKAAASRQADRYQS